MSYINKSLNEYIFASIVGEYNRDERARETASGDKNYIMASDGRRLHDSWVERIENTPVMKAGENGVPVPVLDDKGHPSFYSLDDAPPSLVRRTLAETFQGVLPADSPWLTDAGAKHEYAKLRNDYGNVTGIAMSGDMMRHRQQFGVVFDSNVHAVPCSPFDKEFADREAMLSHGTEILYADPNMLFVQTQNESGQYNLEHRDLSLAQVHDMGAMFKQRVYTDENGRRAEADVITDNWGFKDTTEMVTTADAAGISRLRPFMDDKEFRMASRWMESVPKDERMTEEMTDRSVAILSMLKEQGIPYRIKTDQNPGQLKACIGNTKVDIRLTDTRKQNSNGVYDNGTYIGRVYNDGVSIHVGPLMPSDKAKYKPTITDTLNAVRYGLGHSVDRNVATRSAIAGKVGAESIYTDRKKGTSVRTTYLNPSPDGKLVETAFFGQTKDGTVYIRTQNDHSKSHMNMPTEAFAETFLRDAVDSARRNFENLVNVDYLIEEYEQHKDDNDYVPLLSGDSTISPIQLTYWNVLKGAQELYKTDDGHSVEFEELYDRLNQDDSADTDMSEDADEDDVKTVYDYEKDADVYVGKPADVIKQHLKDNVDMLFGSFEPDKNGVRFSPSLVASFMETAHGTARNKDNLVAAMNKLGFDGSELRGNDFETGTIKDKLLKFDESSSKKLSDIAAESNYMNMVLNSVVGTLRETACEVNPDDVLIDDKGVIQYKAKMHIGKDPKNTRELVGQIGQVFEPDKYGLVETKYYGSKNKLFTPGYDAYIVPKEGENADKSLEERYRFRGLPQVLSENIKKQIRYDVFNLNEPMMSDDAPDKVYTTGETTSINNTYRGLYHTSYKITIESQKDESLKDTYFRQMQSTHMPGEILGAILRTNRGMVHFDKELIDGSAVNAEYREDLRAKSKYVSVHELTNDNVQTPWELTGHQNMAITAEGSGNEKLGVLFDSVMTGSGKNQGAIRYLVVGAGVDAEGKPHFSQKENARAPLLNVLDERYVDSIPADRGVMVSSNLQTASGVAGSAYETDENGNKVRGVGVAQLTCQGLTFDDGAVISKAFAEKYKVIDDKGQLRPLMAGDKLCDQAGNKSIIATVIDPDMDMEEAKKQGVDLTVQLFKNNPTLDVVQAPYSAVSRFNAAGARYAMEDTDSLILPDGSVHEGCIGHVPMTITKHTAEDHTKVYDEDDVRDGKGRKCSAQWVWQMTSKGATHILQEVFGANNTATINLREYLNILGYDIGAQGEFKKGYEPQNGEERHLFKAPEDAMLDSIAEDAAGRLEAKGKMNKAKAMFKSINEAVGAEAAKMFGEAVGTRGGMMEIPFPVKMPSGEYTGTVDKMTSSHPDKDMYALPVLSAHLRSGQTFEDGTKMTHDYTNQYQMIYSNAVSYMVADRMLDKADNDEDKERLEWVKNACAAKASQVYGGIADDIKARKFTAKRNIFRDEIMSRRMPNSATAVWTPKPSLDVNQIAMPQSLADKLKVQQGDRVLVNRDPLLKTDGIRDMEVVIDDSLHGVAVNPAIAISFDGDFDGDSVGIVSVQGEEAKREAYELFSFEQNMLNFAKKKENGDYALMFNDSMDVISAEALDQERYDKAADAIKANYGPDEDKLAREELATIPKSLKMRRLEIEHSFNEVYRDTSMSAEEKAERNKELTKDLSEHTRDVMSRQMATELISYKDAKSHMESIMHVVDSGAKGSPSKAATYARYLGLNFEQDENKRIILDTIEDTGKTFQTAEDIRNTELATAIKSHGTGNAGAFSQRGMTVCRESGVSESLLRLTYLPTQGILQAKHDPEQAKILYASVNSDLRSLWRGYSMAKGNNGWMVEYGPDGQPQQATRDEWVRTFMEVHTDPDGLDLGGSINIEDVEKVADALVGNDGLMRNIEDKNNIYMMADPIDIGAYCQADIMTWLDRMAQDGRGVFDGKMMSNLAPATVRKNIELAAEGRFDEMKPIQPADTRSVGHNVLNVNNTVFGKDGLVTSTLDKDKVITGKDLAARVASFAPEDLKAKLPQADTSAENKGVTDVVVTIPEGRYDDSAIEFGVAEVKIDHPEIKGATVSYLFTNEDFAKNDDGSLSVTIRADKSYPGSVVTQDGATSEVETTAGQMQVFMRLNQLEGSPVVAVPRMPEGAEPQSKTTEVTQEAEAKAEVDAAAARHDERVAMAEDIASGVSKPQVSDHQPNP